MNPWTHNPIASFHIFLIHCLWHWVLTVGVASPFLWLCCSWCRHRKKLGRAPKHVVPSGGTGSGGHQGPSTPDGTFSPGRRASAEKSTQTALVGAPPLNNLYIKEGNAKTHYVRRARNNAVRSKESVTSHFHSKEGPHARDSKSKERSKQSQLQSDELRHMFSDEIEYNAALSGEVKPAISGTIDDPVLLPP